MKKFYTNPLTDAKQRVRIIHVDTATFKRGNKKMRLLTKEIERKLDKTDGATAIVKFFTPDAQATWIVFERDGENPDLLFGMADMGMGFPELGYFSLSEIQALRGPMGLPVERDRHFSNAGKPISWFQSNEPYQW